MTPLKLVTGATAVEAPPAPVTSPLPGSMPWVRCFFDRRISRGAQVEYHGKPARILSAANGFLFVRLMSNERIAVRPYQISFPT